jgi:hypothetical protein
MTGLNRRQGPLACFAVALAASTSLRLPVASGQTAKWCASRAEHAQRLRLAHKLLEARAELRACMDISCPPLVRTDCSNLLEEVEDAIPSVVIRSDGAPQNVVNDGSVTVDGKHASNSVRLAAPETPLLLTQASTPPAPPVAGPQLSSVRVGAWVSAGLALAAFGTSTYLAADTMSELASLRPSCQGSCRSAAMDQVWAKLVIVDVSLLSALVATGVAVWLFAAREEVADGRSNEPLGRIGISPGPRGITIEWERRF